MATIQEDKVTPQWVDDLYQIEMTDPVTGGSDGVANRQAKQLGQRTQFLRKELGNLKDKKASISNIGLVQLSSDIDSSSEDYAATPKAVSQVYKKVEHVASEFKSYLITGGIAELRKTRSSEMRIVQLSAYEAEGHLGGGVFIADHNDHTSADNGGSIIVSDAGVRWKRADKAKIQDFGAKSNGVDDDLDAFKLAMASGLSVYVPPGEYKLSQNVFGNNLWTDGRVIFIGDYAANVFNIKGQAASRLREICANMAAGNAVKIACFGDSTTDGNSTAGWIQNPVDAAGNAVGIIDHAATSPNAWPTKLEPILRDMFKNNKIKVCNAGYSGRRVHDGWAYRNYDAAITRNPSYGHPDICFIGFGLNDIADGSFTVDKFCQHLELLIQKVMATGTVPVILSCDAHRRGGSNARNRVRSSRELDEGKRALCEKYDITYLAIDAAEKDFWAKNKDGHQWRNSQTDGLHYGNVGHAFKASWIASQLFKDVYVYTGTPMVMDSFDSRSGYQYDYSDSSTDNRNRTGANVLVNSSKLKKGDALLTAWIWVDHPDATLIYRGIDNEAMDIAVFDDTNLPTITCEEYIGNTNWRCAPSNLGVARTNATSVVDGQPSGHRITDMPYLLGRLSYGLNKVQYLATGPLSNGSGGFLSTYCGYFEIINSLYNDSAARNVLQTSGAIILNSAVKSEPTAGNCIKLPVESADGCNLISAAYDVDYANGVEFFIDCVRDVATGIILMSNKTFYDNEYPAAGRLCHYLYFSQKDLGSGNENVINFGFLYADGETYANSHTNIFTDKPIAGLGDKFTVRIQRINKEQQRLTIYNGWQTNADPVVDETFTAQVPLVGMAGGVFSNFLSTQALPKFVSLNQMIVKTF